MGQRLASAGLPTTQWPANPLPGAGLPHERLARIAAREAFLEMRTQFLDALDGLHGSEVESLRRDLRGSSDPGDLWALRLAMHDALAAGGIEPTPAQSRFAHTLHRAFNGIATHR